MNKIYKVIWSKVKHCYVVVSELTKRDGKSASPTGLLGRKAAVLAVMALCGVGAVLPTMPVRADTIGTYHAGDLKWDKDKHNKAEWDPNHPVTDEDYGSIGVRSGKSRLSFLMGLISGDTVAGKEDGLAEELKHRTAIGNRFRVFGFGATAYGYGTNAVGEGSLAVGHAATTNGNEGTAIGSYAKVLKGQGTVVGAHSWANDQAVALGADVRAQGYASISIGSDDADPNAFTGSKFSDKLPEETIKKIYKDMINDNPDWFKNKYMLDSTGNDRRVWSPNYAAGEASIAIGSRTVALGDASTSIGVLAMALADRSTAVGVRSLVSSGAKGGMALGEESRVMSKDGLAVGNKTYSSGDGSLAYGYDAKALGANSIAIGHNVGANAMLNSEAQNTMANVLLYNGEGKIKPTGTSFDTTQDRINYLEKIMAAYDKKDKQWVDDEGGVLRQWKDGNNGPYRTEYRKKQAQTGPKQWSDNAIAIGRRTYAIGNNSLVLGSLSLGAGNNSLNVGHFTYTKGENSAAIGMESAAIADNSMAIGVRSFANLTNSVAIGVGSKTDYTKDDLEQDGWAPRNAITFPSSTQVGVVSVGKIGSERRISNVASGYRDTDAVNVSQLRSLEERFSSNLPEDSDLNPFSYLAVDKKSGDVTKVIPLQKKEMNYRKYVNYRIKQIELQVREKNKENVDETFKKRIQSVITNLEKGDNKTGIDASGLKGKNVDTILNELKAKYPGLDTSDTNDVINKLNEWKKEKLKDSLKKALTEKEQGFLDGTNYLNDGAKGKDAIAVGYKAQSLADNSIAIGKDSHVDKGAQGGIALGASSSATRAGGQFAYDFDNDRVFADDKTAGKGNGGLRANKSTSGALSIGSDSITRQITNVAGGSEDTDAVNVAQLKQVNNKINGVDNKINGVDNKINGVDNKVTDVNTKVEGNIGFNIEGNSGGQPWVAAGTKDSQKGKISLKIRGGDNDSNINVDLGRSTNDGFDTIEAKINLKHNLGNLESATFTKTEKGVTTTSVINDKGLTIGSGNTAVALTKDGLNNGNHQIHGVADGKADTDAVNVAQVNKAIQVKADELKNNEIKAAQNTATAANSTANTANTTATQAKSTASEAKSTAEQAKDVADKVNTALATYKTEVTTALGKKANTDLDNLTQNGKTVVKNLAKDQIDTTVTETFVTGKVKKGSVTSKTLTVTGDGKVVGADLTLDIKDKAISKGKLSGELVKEIEGKATKAEVANKAEKTYVDNQLNTKVNTSDFDTYKGKVTTDLAGKADVDGGNITAPGQWAGKLGTGEVVENNANLVTGGKVFAAIKDKADKSELTNKADTSLSNIAAAGKTVIKDLAKGAVKVADGTNTTVITEDGTDGSKTYKVNVSDADIKKAVASDLDNKADKSTVTADLANKADKDASNITDVTAWAEKLGTGTVAENNANLVTGGKVYAAIKDKADKSELTNKADTSLSNIAAAGKTVIKNLAKDAVKVAAGTNTTVTTEDGKDGSKTYKVNVSDADIKKAVASDLDNKADKSTVTADLANKADKDASNITDVTAWANKLGTGKVADNDTNLVTGKTVKAALDKKVDTSTYTAGMATKADANGSNVTNPDTWAEKLGTGTVAENNANLVTGGKVFAAIKDKADKSELTNKADTSLSNIAAAGKTAIKDLAKDAVKVAAGTNTTVTTEDGTDGSKTYKVNVSDADIKKAVASDLDNKADKSTVTADLANKADKDASNITDVTAWANKLGTGKVADNDTNLVTGKTVKAALDKKVDTSTYTAGMATKADANGSNVTNPDTWAEKLGTGTVAENNANLVTGGKVFAAIKDKADKSELTNKADTSFSNIAAAGKTVIKNLAKDAVKVAAGTNTTVTTEDGKDGSKTYKVNVSDADIKKAVASDLDNKADKSTVTADLANKADKDASNITDVTAWANKLGTGKVADNDTNLVTGKTVKAALDKKVDTSTYTAGMATKADANGSNVTNPDTWAEKLGTGTVAENNANLVTGGKVFAAIKDKADKSELTNKADTSLNNITAAGKTVIKNLAKDAVKVAAGTNTTVTTEDGKDGSKTYKVNVSDADIKKAVASDLDNKADKSTVTADLANKADKDASNITDVTAWANKLGTGTISDNDANLVTGKTVKAALDKKVDTSTYTAGMATKADANGSNVTNPDTWAEKLGTGTVAENNANLVTGGKVFAALNPIKTKSDNNATAITKLQTGFTIKDEGTGTSDVTLGGDKPPTITFKAATAKTDGATSSLVATVDADKNVTYTLNTKKLKEELGITGKGVGSMSSWKIQATGGTATNVADGETVEFGTEENQGLTVKQTGKTIKYGINTDTVIDNINSSITKKITNVDGDNIDLSKNTAITNIKKTLSSGFKVKAGDTEETVALDNENPEKVEFKAVSENNSFTVGITKDDTTHTKTITYKLSDNLTFGTAGENGKDGTIGVNGKDGSSVTINGKDGSIGLNGTNGQNGLSIRGEKGTEGKPGVDGKTTIKRIVITDPDGKNPHSVATLDDGLKFKGDIGDAAPIKLNNQVNIVGGETVAANLSDGNIGVDTTKDENNAKLTVKLAKNLKNLESATFTKTVENNGKKETTSTVINDSGTTVTDKDGNTNQTTAGGTVIQTKDGKEKVEIKKDGLTIGNNTDATKNVSLTKDGLNMAEQEIKNVKESTTTTSAATVGQINKAKEALKTEIDKKADKDTVTADLANKANKNASNIGEAERTAWANKLGTGTISDNDANLVTGGTVKAALDKKVDTSTYTAGMATKADANGSNVTNPDTWAEKLGTGTVAENNANLVTGGKVFAALNPVKTQAETNATNITGLTTRVSTNESDIKTLQGGFTLQDANTSVGKQTVKAGSKVTVTGDDYIKTKVDTNGLNLSMDETKLKSQINTQITSNSTVTGKMSAWKLKANGDTKEQEIKDGNTVTFDVETDKGLTVSREGNTIKYGINASQLANNIINNVVTNINDGKTAITNISTGFTVSAGNNTPLAMDMTKDKKPNLQFVSKDGNTEVTAEKTATGTKVTIGLSAAAQQGLANQDLNFAGKSGTGKVNLKTQTLSITGDADGIISTTAKEQGLSMTVDKEKLASAVNSSTTQITNVDLSNNSIVKGKMNSWQLAATSTDDGAKIDNTNNKAVFDVAETNKGLTVTRTGNTIKYGINGSQIDISGNTSITNINNTLTAGFKVKAGKTEETVGLGNKEPETVEFKAVSENNSLTVGITKDDTTHTKTITYKLSDNLTFGTAGENGKDGTIGVNGKDGSSVTINGKDGSIGLNGTNGQNGLSIRGEKGTEGKPGVDGKTTIKRIVITDPDGKNPHSVATLDDGLKFKGDIGDAAPIKLNNQVNIVGGETVAANLSDGNIGVDTTKDENNAKLTVKLAKNLKNLESATFTKTVENNGKKETTSTVINDSGTTVTDKDGNTNQTTAGGTVIQTKDGKEKVEIKKDGLTIGNNTDSTKNISLTKDGLNMAEQEIKNVKESTTTTSAATVGQINKAKEALKTEIDKKADKDTVTADLANKANKNASNIGEAERTAWANKLGTGTISDNDANLVTGGTVKAALDKKVDTSTYTEGMATKADANGSNVTNPDTWAEKLGTGTVAENDTNLVTGKTVYDFVNPVKTQTETNKKDIATLQEGFTIQDETTPKAGTKVIKAKDTITFKSDANLTSKVGDDGSVTYGLNSALTNMNSITFAAPTAPAGGTSKALTINGTAGTITGLTNTTWDGKTIVTGRAATEDQLKALSETVNGNASSSTDFRLVASTDTKGYTPDKSGTVTLDVKDKNHENKDAYQVTISNVASKSDVDKMLNEGFTVGEAGKPGKDGKDGKVEVVGKDGSAVVINGKDGSIGLKGKDGKDGIGINGKDGGSITIHGTNGADGQDGENGLTIRGVDGKNGEKGEKGVDGTTTINRIVTVDPNGTKHQLATLDDGLKFAGNVGNFYSKLNEIVEIVGGVTVGENEKAEDKLTDENIGVVAKKEEGKNGKLDIKLAKDLKNLSSATFTKTVKNGDKDETTSTVINDLGTTVTDKDGNTNQTTAGGTVIQNKDGKEKVEIKKDGITITDVEDGTSDNPKKKISLTKDGFNNGGNKITNIADGEKNSDAATVGQVEKAKTDLTTAINNKADYALAKGDGQDGAYKVTDGKITLKVKNKTKPDDAAEDVVIDDVASKSSLDTLKEEMKKNIQVGGKGADGADGVDGTIGVNGKDGKPGIGINGKDGGSITIHGTNGADGKDGQNGVTIRGVDGKKGEKGEKGVDGTTTINRIVTVDPNGTTHQVATLDDGLKFAGNVGSFYSKLNETVEIVGGVTVGENEKAEDKLTDENIGVVATKEKDKNGKLNIKLAKDLKNLSSAEFIKNVTTPRGDVIKTTTVIDGDSIMIRNGSVNAVTITGNRIAFGQPGGTITGLTNTTWPKDTTKNFDAGQAATQGQLKILDDKLNKNEQDRTDFRLVASADTNGYTPNTSGTVTLDVKDKNHEDKDAYKVTISNVARKSDVDKMLKDGFTVGKAGKDGTDGKVEVVGKDGSAVVIKGADGSIGLNGKDGKDSIGINGKDGGSITIHGTNGVDGKDGENGVTIRGVDGKNGEKGEKGVDGKDINRIVTVDPNGTKHQVATLDDGLQFAGDSGTAIAKKLNETVTISGGVTDETKLSDNNIGVVAKDGKLNIKLAKKLDGLESATFTKTVKNGDKEETTSTVINDLGTTVTDKDGNTNQTTAGGTVIQNKDGSEKIEIKKDGITIMDAGDGTPAHPGKTISLTKDGFNNGGNKITNIADGTGANDAATVGQVNAAKKEVMNTLASGFDIKAGSVTGTVSLKADEKPTVEFLSAGNGLSVDLLTDAKTHTQKITYRLSDTPVFGEKAVPGEAGKPGKDGKVEVIGKDGSAVTINGKDGSIGLNGTNGQNGLSIRGEKGTEGKPGVDGTTIKRLVITDPDGKNPHAVATLDDGLKFAGNVGNFYSKLNETVEIVGGVTVGENEKAEDKLTDENIGVVANKEAGKNGKLDIKLAKNLKDLSSATFTKTVKHGDKEETTSTVINDLGTTVTDKDGNTNQMTAGGITITTKQKDGKENTVSLTKDGLNNGGKKIVQVADGDLSDKSQEAVTGKQLYATNQRLEKTDKALQNGIDFTVGKDTYTAKLSGDKAPELSFSGGDNITANLKDQTIQYSLNKDINVNSVTAGTTSMNGEGIKIKGQGTADISLTAQGLNNGGKKIRAVADGLIAPNSTEAVTGRQLYQTNAGIVRISDDVMRVGAGAAALAALHTQDFDPADKWDFAAGYGNYKSANALSLGAFYRPNERTTFSVGSAFGSGANFINAGVTIKLGDGKYIGTSKAALVKAVEDQQQEIDRQKQKLQSQSAEIQNLQQRDTARTAEMEALKAKDVQRDAELKALKAKDAQRDAQIQKMMQLLVQLQKSKK